MKGVTEEGWVSMKGLVSMKAWVSMSGQAIGMGHQLDLVDY